MGCLKSFTQTHLEPKNCSLNNYILNITCLSNPHAEHQNVIVVWKRLIKVRMHSTTCCWNEQMKIVNFTYVYWSRCVRNALNTKLFSIYWLIQYVCLPLFCSIGVAIFLHVTSATVVAVDDISGLVHFLLTAVFPFTNTPWVPGKSMFSLCSLSV